MDTPKAPKKAWKKLTDSNIKKLIFIGGLMAALAAGGYTIVKDLTAKDSTTPNVTINPGSGIAAQNLTINDHGMLNQTVTNNYYHSADYQALQRSQEQAQQRLARHPDDADFQRDVIQLAEQFQKIPLNTERLKQAKQAFEAGDFAAARRILAAEALASEQAALLAKQQQLNQQQQELSQQLTDNAQSYLLKARLTALDYSLPDRIEQTRRYYQAALQAQNLPEHGFAYAKFLQDNNQFKEAEAQYREVLAQYRQLAQANPAVYVSQRS